MKQRLKMLFLILLGNTLLAFSICAFAVPHDFMLGGVTGIGLIVQEFFVKTSYFLITKIN